MFAIAGSVSCGDHRHGPQNMTIVLNTLAGYDMRFDIKYAYFNFLQSVVYPSACDSSGDAGESEGDDEPRSPSMVPAGDDDRVLDAVSDDTENEG